MRTSQVSMTCGPLTSARRRHSHLRIGGKPSTTSVMLSLIFDSRFSGIAVREWSPTCLIARHRIFRLGIHAHRVARARHMLRRFVSARPRISPITALFPMSQWSCCADCPRSACSLDATAASASSKPLYCGTLLAIVRNTFAAARPLYAHICHDLRMRERKRI